ncbi:unnamed protein product [Prorocentrum cordatum]|uniref:Uncharacterized protein n=1 Tax=Prorocentrum cordatum TaxID=2364126 RepID=A0ABN9R7D5_9DINO|nr:unnamed protein product [Polarella glacialis]
MGGRLRGRPAAGAAILLRAAALAGACAGLAGAAPADGAARPGRSISACWPSAAEQEQGGQGTSARGAGERARPDDLEGALLPLLCTAACRATSPPVHPALTG